MCGIVAAITAGAPAPALDAGLAALAHRGPDGRGQWRSSDRTVALGHVRLAVVDPAGGAQPIANEDGTIVAVVNGELYDHERHAHALAARGHRLTTRCDAEILVHLYEELGDDVVRALRGELAFVLWDGRRRRLVAARDRFGIKPLVWARVPGGIALASEAKALFALGVPARWDAEAFFHAAHVQYPWPDRTLFAAIHQLEPAHVLVVEDGAPRSARYWDLPAHGELGLDAGAERLRAALADAVAVRTRADANVCVQLSGGIDSSSVAALAARSGVTACFTVAFAGGGAHDAYDERSLARATADALGMTLDTVELDAASIATQWADAVAHGEGLAINGHVVAKWLLSRAMRDAGFKVALTGEGADELLAGYPHLRRDAGAPDSGAHVASRGVMLPSEGQAIALASVRARLGYVPTWLAAKAELGARVRRLLASDLLATYADVDPYAALVERVAPTGGDRLRTSAASWTRTALAQYILKTLGDGMEMAHGIEGRVPFLDPEVAEAACAIAPAVLVGDAVDKPVLRRAMADIVPAHVRQRPKHPFLAPPLSAIAPALVQDTLRTHARSSPLIDAEALVAVLDALPAMSRTQQQAWDPALSLVLSAAILQARYT